jgi:nicotinate (nicotinamide) nucleotide adenylyltransferase
MASTTATAIEEAKEDHDGRRKKKRVVLFGTSGNPPTGRGGHSGIIEFLMTLGKYDEAWVLPVYRHMYRDKRELMGGPGGASFEQRVAMCKLAFEPHGIRRFPVRVLETEKEVYETKVREGVAEGSVRVSTYDVVTWLKARHPGKQFSFILGADAYRDLAGGKWACSEQLLNAIDFIVVERSGIKIGQESVFAEGVHVHHIPFMTDISSTRLRLTDEPKFLCDANNLDPVVLRYIRKHKLYYYGRRQELRRRIAVRTLAVTASLVAAVSCRLFYVAWKRKG